MHLLRAAARLAPVVMLLAATTRCHDSTTQPTVSVPASTTAPQETADATAAPTTSAPPVATPPPTPTVSATPTPTSSAAPTPALAAKIKSTFGGQCHFERACGTLWGIDCDAAVDGPYYYVKAETLEKVASCGGFCMGGRCTNCPPKEWTCATY